MRGARDSRRQSPNGRARRVRRPAPFRRWCSGCTEPWSFLLIDGRGLSVSARQGDRAGSEFVAGPHLEWERPAAELVVGRSLRGDQLDDAAFRYFPGIAVVTELGSWLADKTVGDCGNVAGDRGRSGRGAGTVKHGAEIDLKIEGGE